MDTVIAIVMVLGMILIAGAFCAIPVWLIVKLVRWMRPKCPKCNQRKTKCLSRRCIQDGDEMHMRETECQLQCLSCGNTWSAIVTTASRSSRDDDSGPSDSSSSSDNDNSISDFGGGESGGGGVDRDF